MTLDRWTQLLWSTLTGSIQNRHVTLACAHVLRALAPSVGMKDFVFFLAFDGVSSPQESPVCSAVASTWQPILFMT